MTNKDGDGRLLLAPLGEIMRAYWAISRGTIVLIVLAVIGSSSVSVIVPYLFSRLIDRMGGNAWAELIVIGFVAYAVLVGLALTLQSVTTYLAVMSADNLNFIAATRFFSRLVRKTPRFFVTHNPAEIQSAQMQGTQTLQSVVQLTLMTLLPGLAQLALTLTVLGTVIDGWSALTVLVYGGVYIALTYFSNVWTRPHLERATNALQRNAQLVGNAIMAIDTLSYCGSVAWINDRFRTGAREVLDNWQSYCRKRIAYGALRGLALMLQFIVAFALFLPRYRDGTVSVGDIVLFNTLLLQLNLPFEMMGFTIESLMQAREQFRPFARLWAEPEEEDGPTAQKAFPAGMGSLAFENVGFSYEDGRGIADVSFVAKRGTVTFITGPTGAGKSTIFKLALKTLTPARGRILVNGADLALVGRPDWYRAIGVVPQEVMLMNDTLRSNIVLGRDMSEQKLRNAALKAAILERIEALPDGFDTVVGERGLKLSGGERQRIAIARALYGDPEFLFLDEASSALDEATETDIMEHIRAIADTVTVLAITHRHKTIRPADNVVVLPETGNGQKKSRRNPTAALGDLVEPGGIEPHRHPHG